MKELNSDTKIDKISSDPVEDEKIRANINSEIAEKLLTPGSPYYSPPIETEIKFTTGNALGLSPEIFSQIKNSHVEYFLSRIQPETVVPETEFQSEEIGDLFDVNAPNS